MTPQGNELIEWREGLIASLSFAVCLGTILAVRWCPRLAGRPADMTAVQSAHSRLTPRVGGLGIFLAVLAMIALSAEAIREPYLHLALASSLLFAAGILEDLGFGVSPRMRLLVAALSSLVVILLLDVWLPRLGIVQLDHLALHWMIGIPLTLLITVGVANGFNLIDGVHGLAGVTAVSALVCLALIARGADYIALSELCMMMAAAVVGFLVLNYPLGLIFLGDAGAYVIGFVISWFGIAILVTVPEATPWAILLVVFWPVADTGLAIYRRQSRKVPNMQPDRLHVHQMVMRTLELAGLGRKRRRIANPLTTLILSPFIVLPPAVGVLLWDKPLPAFLAVLGFAGLFVASYLATFRLVRRVLPGIDMKRPRDRARLPAIRDVVRDAGQPRSAPRVGKGLRHVLSGATRR